MKIIKKITPNPIVWSSDSGDLCKLEARPATVKASLHTQQQTVYLHRDSKHWAGVGVTLLKGLVLTEPDLTALVKAIKQTCDC